MKKYRSIESDELESAYCIDINEEQIDDKRYCENQQQLKPLLINNHLRKMAATIKKVLKLFKDEHMNLLTLFSQQEN